MTDTRFPTRRLSRSARRMPQGALLCALLLTGPALAATTLAPVTGGTYQSVIVDWPQGQTGAVRLSDNLSDLAFGTIDSTGHFSITLPGVTALATNRAKVSELFTPTSNYLDSTAQCKGQGTATPATAGYKYFTLTAYSGGIKLADLKLKSTTRLPYPVGQGYSQLVFFDAPTTLDGVVTCLGFVETLKGSFPAGWSLPSGVVTSIDATTYNNRLTADPLPDTVGWHLYNEYVGIGLNFDAPQAGATGVMVSRVTVDSPAALAGIRATDLLVQVDGKDVTGLTADQLVALIRGDAGTTVTLGLLQGSATEITQIKVTRALIRIP